MDFQAVVDRLSELSSEVGAPNDVAEYTKTCASQIATEISTGDRNIIQLIKGLNTILTNSSHEIRSRGVNLLAQVVTNLPKNQLTEKEIEHLNEFLCLRLVDHKSMEDAALDCLLHFADCDNKPAKFNKQVMDFLKEKANIRRMHPNTRYRAYELLRKFVMEKKRKTNSINGEFIYSLVTILDGESHPENLMLCFGMVAFILKNFHDLEPFLDDIFEWLGSYYPVDYTPVIDKGARCSIQRADLVDALYECFYANDLNADHLMTLLLEKLDSNVLSSQLESLECLIKCYEKPFPLANITKFNSTLWTAIRMNCLKKIDNVDPKLLEASLRTLTALAVRLLEDKEMHFTFISDMYDELAIAFRKPEMELFDAAARLMTHSILPNQVGFNYILNKILPITLNALEANELRPLSGVDYIFRKLSQEHPHAKFEDGLSENVAKLVLKVADLTATGNKDCVTLLESLICQQVDLDDASLTKMIDSLKAQCGKSSLDVEKCLALICYHYQQFNLITDTSIDQCDLGALFRLVYQFEPSSIELDRFSLYLRILKLELTSCPGAQLDGLDQSVLNDALVRLRNLLQKVHNKDIVEKSALIHAVVLNKLEAKNANQVAMSLFSSKYCQDLISSNTNEESQIARQVYLPHVRCVFKGLVLRNHQLVTPMINLILNCIKSENVDCELACDAARTFSFILEDDELLERNCHFQIFSLYKQKFYMQTSKEIRLRYDQLPTNDGAADRKRSLLILAIASQLTHLPLAVFRRDQEWLAREILRVLTIVSSSDSDPETVDRAKGEENSVEGVASVPSLVRELYKCLESLIRKDCEDVMVSFLPSIIDLSLKNAQQAKSMEVRRQALFCLTGVVASFKDADLLVYRNSTIDHLRPCLADKKRLVRQAAAEARLRWSLVGQPIGSS